VAAVAGVGEQALDGLSTSHCNAASDKWDAYQVVEYVPCVRDQPRCLQRENPSGVHMSKTIDEKAVKLPPLK
jgi:hypothetical protein